MYDNEFGEIKLTRRTGMRNITARWRNDVLCINTSPLVPIGEIILFIGKNREKLRILRQNALRKASPEIHYRLGQRIPCLKGDILITAIKYRPNFTGYKCDKDGNLFILISDKDDINTDIKQKAVSGALKELMKRTAPHVLIPYAWEVAQETGVQPKEFVIGRGIRKLGHCTSKKVIQLSYMLMFMPEELVRYVICHELAHLTIMNHSPQFHSLCNILCNGKEKALEKKLKGFTFPILK